MKERKVFLILAAIFLGIGTIFLAVAISITIFSYGFFQDALSTEGVISDIVRDSSSHDKQDHDVYITYNIDGQEYESEINYYSSSMEIGQKITVYYIEDNKTDIRIKEYLLPIIFGSIGAVFFIIGFVFLLLSHKRRQSILWLKEHGIRINARITGVSLLHNISVNNRHPYVVNCQYVDEVNKAVYNFRSDYLWYNPSEQLQGDEITVLVDPINFKKYSVELERVLPDYKVYNI